ncbi:MAG: 30S ribosome-binding factor RbfA [Caldilineaceae bacterium]|nr:30S ribosome-binding factor RbfA [Caldilineaceae bacterium]MCB9156248.1 30S ribosome-binding factor RbfA [Caldilineaceae bacterium]
MATIRQQRVAGLLFEELSIMLNGELSDPRVSLITVTGVQLSKDLRNAKVHIYHQNEEFSRKEVLAGLRSATPYLRSQLASRCGLRMVPEILFYYDDTPERAARIDELLSQIAQERGERTEDETAAPAEPGDAP